jgi:hypothetical protein
MTPQKQTIGGLDESREGNCMATCVACILDMPVSQVPNFIESRRTFEMLADFLDKRGYKFDGFWYNPPADWGQRFKGVDGYTIVGGPSPRPYVSAHAVIYKNGKPFWDPHEDDTFTLGIKRIYLITRK